VSANLNYAILAMDAYERSSNPQGGTTQLPGNTQYFDESHGPDFHAYAYQQDGQVVIAYRGTDQIPQDSFSGWTAATPFATLSSQLADAFAFYKAVDAATNDPIVLVGHSLGGVLAGIVSAFHHRTAVIFDTPTFAFGIGEIYAAILNAFSAPPDPIGLYWKDIVYGPDVTYADIVDPVSTYRAFHVEGDATSFLAVAGKQWLIPPSGDTGLSPVDLHNPALAAILLKAEQYRSDLPAPGSWEDGGSYVLKSLFDNTVAQKAGFSSAQSDFGGSGLADHMIRAIAYSGFSSGGPAGDLALGALLNDATDIGDALSLAANNSSDSDAIAQMLADFATVYAGAAALSGASDGASSGVLNHQNSETANVVNVDLSDETWTAVGGGSLNEDALREEVTEYIFTEAELNQDWRDLMDAAGLMDMIDTAGFDLGGPASFVANNELDKSASLFWVSGGATDIKASSGNDVIIASSENASGFTINTGGGVDMLVGSEGSDTFIHDPEFYNEWDWVGAWGLDGNDTFEGVGYASGGAGADTFDEVGAAFGGGGGDTFKNSQGVFVSGGDGTIELSGSDFYYLTLVEDEGISEEDLIQGDIYKAIQDEMPEDAYIAGALVVNSKNDTVKINGVELGNPLAIKTDDYEWYIDIPDPLYRDTKYIVYDSANDFLFQYEDGVLHVFTGYAADKNDLTEVLRLIGWENGDLGITIPEIQFGTQNLTTGEWRESFWTVPPEAAERLDWLNVDVSTTLKPDGWLVDFVEAEAPVVGDDGNNVLGGSDNTDTLIGEAGNDELIGGLGNDTYRYRYGDGDDVIREDDSGGAEDILQLSGINLQSGVTLSASGNDLLISVAESAPGSSNQGTIVIEDYLRTGTEDGVEILMDSVGNLLTKEDVFRIAFANSSGGVTRTGTEWDDQLYGTEQYDEFRGGAGNDYIGTYDGNDLLFGGDGADYLYGDAGNDTLFGENGDDYLHDESGDDFIYGGDGNDTFVNREGNDTLEGGQGEDLFVFDESYSRRTGSDLVTDFQVGVDKIHINRALERNFSEVMAGAQEMNGDTWLHINNGDVIVLQGVGISLLTSSDFIIT
jgi:Ca2+-binding RTX toxin-like protein